MALQEKINERWLKMIEKKEERKFALLLLDLVKEKISPEDFREKYKTIPAEVTQHANTLYILASIIVLSETIEKLEERVKKIEAKI